MAMESSSSSSSSSLLYLRGGLSSSSSSSWFLLRSLRFSRCIQRNPSRMLCHLSSSTTIAGCLSSSFSPPPCRPSTYVSRLRASFSTLDNSGEKKEEVSIPSFTFFIINLFLFPICFLLHFFCLIVLRIFVRLLLHTFAFRASSSVPNFVFYVLFSLYFLTCFWSNLLSSSFFAFSFFCESGVYSSLFCFFYLGFFFIFSCLLYLMLNGSFVGIHLEN